MTLASAGEEPFAAGSGWHVAMVAVGAAVLATLVLLGRARGTAGRERRVAGVLAGLSLAIVAASWWYWLALRVPDIRKDLPLQACDWAGVFAPLALWTRWRWLRAALFYWSLAFTVNAFVTPTVRVGPGTVEFWCFWLSHLAILACATYDFWVRGFRPTWRDCRRGLLTCYVWLAVVVPFNLVMGANYGYLGDSRPDAPTLVDHLGPWPGRMILMIAIGHAVFGLLTWVIGRVPGGEARRASARMP